MRREPSICSTRVPRTGSPFSPGSLICSSPEVARKRDVMWHDAGHVILIVDNYTADTGPNIMMCPLSPHSSNQVQPLDVLTVIRCD
jgi:hypothetical protein